MNKDLEEQKKDFQKQEDSEEGTDEKDEFFDSYSNSNQEEPRKLNHDRANVDTFG